MEHPFVLDYIKQRMKHLGISDFHYESVRVENDANDQAVIDSSNQYHFLVEKTVDATLEIISDTGVLTPAESAEYSNQTFNNIREFTGQIMISGLTSSSIEFVRVIPLSL